MHRCSQEKGPDMEPIAIAILIAAALGLYALSRRKTSKPPEPVSVTLDGDSIMVGVWLQRGIAARMRELRPDWVIDDRGVVGLKLYDLLRGYQEPSPGAPPERYPRGPQPPYAQVARSTRFVVIEAGGNDTLDPIDVGAWEADLREALRIVQAEGRVPVLTGIVDFDDDAGLPQGMKARRDACNAITHRVAQELGLQHAGWGEDYQGPRDRIDPLHRSQEASDRLATLLVDAIEHAR